VLTILFDGIAYGMLLFVLACGLAVTLGLMNFVNLAHGAFAMAGGYVTAVLMNRLGVPFLATLPLAFLIRRRSGSCWSARSMSRSTTATTSTRCCSPSASSSWRSRRWTTRWARSSSSSSCRLAARAVEILGVQVGLYRSFIIAVCGVLVVACSSS
jgi:branched-chain amino acid transport system permease protein